MPHKQLIPAFGAIAFLALVATTRADEAEDLFTSLYGPKLKQVQATADFNDDVAFAKELTAAAKTAAEQPKLVVVLCRSAYDLASRREPGWEAAGLAIEQWIESAPQTRAEAYDRLIDLRQKQYAAARLGSARTESGQALIDALLQAAKLREDAKEAGEAAALQRRALVVARGINPKKAEEIQIMLDAQKRREWVAHRVMELQTSLLENAKDSAKAEELVRLLIFEVNDSAKAASPLALVTDAEFKSNAALAMKPVAELKEEEAFSLGMWSHRLSTRTVEAAPKAAMHATARTAFERFLALHAAKDLKRTQVELILKQLPTDSTGSTAASDSTEPEDPSKPEKTNLKEGMLGRLVMAGKDTDIVFHYQPGTTFIHSVVEEQVVKLGGEMRGVSIALTGKISVPKPITLDIRLAGGSPSGGVTYLHIDNVEVGAVGDDRSKDTTYKRSLAPGIHDIRLTVTGGHIGGNLLLISDPDGKPLTIVPDKTSLKGGKKLTLVENSQK